jgi:hypothetical protein
MLIAERNPARLERTPAITSGTTPSAAAESSVITPALVVSKRR